MHALIVGSDLPRSRACAALGVERAPRWEPRVRRAISSSSL